MRARRVVVVGIVLAGGCGTSPVLRSDRMADAVYSRSSAAFSCPDVSVAPVGGNGYVARGCGLTQSYTCMRRPQAFDDEVTCVPDSAPTSATSSAAVAAAPTAAGVLTAADEQTVRGASSSCGVANGSLEIELASSGAIQRASLSAEATTDVRGCVAAALRRAAFEASASARAGTVSLVASPPRPSTAAETSARAIVEEQRDMILACTSATATAVVARWNADGAVALALPDALAGTPEDGCVRSLVVRTAITPAPGGPGSVLQAVHR